MAEPIVIGGTPTEKKKLIIIGTADNRKDAPFDEDVVIWGTGGVLTAPDVTRCDAVFELHPERYWKMPNVLPVLAGYKGIIYMQEKVDEIPTSCRYPIEAVKQQFYIPTMGRSLYITNTVAFMFALAYLEGYKEIETFGVWMEHATEYTNQRTNLEYYVGYLTAKGVKITLHAGEVLKSSFLYAYEEPVLFARLIEDGGALANGKTDLQNKVTMAQREMWMQEGGIRYNKDLRRKFGGY